MTQVIDFIGGEYRNRTGVHGFAIRCVTTPPTRLAMWWRRINASGDRLQGLVIDMCAGATARVIALFIKLCETAHECSARET